MWDVTRDDAGAYSYRYTVREVTLGLATLRGV